MVAVGEKARMVSDIKLSENVTISVIPRNKGGEEGEDFNLFKPSRRLQRSPVTGSRAEMEVTEEIEGSFGIRDSDHSTPVADRGAVTLTNKFSRRVAERNARIKQGKAAMVSEAEDSARDDTQTSDVDDDGAMISRAELRGFMQALAGAVQMLNVLVRKFKLDKDKDEGIREIGNLINGILSSLEQCSEQKTRRRKRRMEPSDEA